MENSFVARLKRHKLGLLGAVAGVAALAVTATFTLGGFSAGISDQQSTFSSAVVAFSESSGGTTCYNTGNAPGTVTSGNQSTSCTINPLGVDGVPGVKSSTTVTVTNTGNYAPSTASLVVGTAGSSACAASGASDNGGYVGSDTTGTTFCGDVDVTIQNSTTGDCVFPYNAAAACPATPTSAGTLAGLAGDTFNVGSGTPSGFTQYGLSLPGGTGESYVITTMVDGTNGTNADQGLKASLNFTWSISQ